VGVKALGAFSGGLDGMIAALVLGDQGIEVTAVTFDSPFFSGERGRRAAAEIGVSWRPHDFTDDILSLLEDPPSGFGSRCNPCIDCHARMFEILFGICDEEGFDFVFTGEVLGQRPMSQNRGSLNRVARLSGHGDRLLRPLSALLLDPILPEREGLVDRSRLLDISGRGRKRQMEIARSRGISYETPAGGCLLTDPGYSARLRLLMTIPSLLSGTSARLIRHGRMFRIGDAALGLVGRSRGDNDSLEALAMPGQTFEIQGVPGPTGVLLGSATGSGEVLLGSLMALYSKVEPGEEVTVLSGAGHGFTVTPADPGLARSLIVTV
jgi:hypothetical protein